MAHVRYKGKVEHEVATEDNLDERINGLIWIRDSGPQGEPTIKAFEILDPETGLLDSITVVALSATLSVYGFVDLPDTDNWVEGVVKSAKYAAADNRRSPHYNSDHPAWVVEASLIPSLIINSKELFGRDIVFNCSSEGTNYIYREIKTKED